MNNDFAQDVRQGLSSKPKYLKSKYFYDAEGDKLFQKIMGLSEYYLTDCEFEIIQQHREKLLQAFSPSGKPFLLGELGAGDGLKTKLLLKYFHSRQANFTYLPNDISENVLNILKKDLSGDLPGLRVRPYPGDYFEALDRMNQSEKEAKAILFLGSTIGNFLYSDAIAFLGKINQCLNPSDQLLIGFDLKKDPRVILKAYNDPSGITARFNLNLLKRINRELEGEFKPENFYHYPIYNPLNGETRSFLISKMAQRVKIKALNAVYHFKMGEAISMEISQKYDLDMIHDLAAKSGFSVQSNYFDNRHYFVDSLWIKK